MKKFVQLLALSAVASAFVGCSTYTKQSEDMVAAWKSGDSALTASLLTKKVEKVEGKKDEVIWNLEYGTVLAANGDIKESTKVFDYAETLMNEHAEKAKISVTKEGTALLTNQANLPYRGRDYDKIMVSTYKAMNYMVLSEPEKARVELQRCLQHQKDAVAENAKRIAKVQEEAAKAKQGEIDSDNGEKAPEYDVEQAQQDPQFSGAINEHLAGMEKHNLPYADYVNPFSVFLDAMYFSHHSQGTSDTERALKSFERVRDMSPSKYIDADYAMAEAMAQGATAEPVTYVLFMTGSAPQRDQVRIDIPLFLVSEVSYVGAAFPKLKYHDNYIPTITAVTKESTTNGLSTVNYKSELLCSMDAVITKDFKNDWPVVLTKTLISTATKAIAAYFIEEAAEQAGGSYGALTKLAAKVMTIGYQASTNIADTRTWRTLPKQISYIRMPTPEQGSVNLKIGTHLKTVEVEPGVSNVIMVRSVVPESDPIVKNVSFKKD